MDAVAALKSGAPRIRASHPGNLAFETTLGDGPKTEAAFAAAAHVVS